MKTSMIYMTASGPEEARRIARALVEERLVACVNMLGGIESIYRWQGRVEEAKEVAMVAKTADDRVPALIERVKALHSYDTPCIVALPIADGAASFLEWVRSETRPEEASRQSDATGPKA